MLGVSWNRIAARVLRVAAVRAGTEAPKGPNAPMTSCDHANVLLVRAGWSAALVEEALPREIAMLPLEKIPRELLPGVEVNEVQACKACGASRTVRWKVYERESGALTKGFVFTPWGPPGPWWK